MIIIVPVGSYRIHLKPSDVLDDVLEIDVFEYDRKLSMLPMLNRSEGLALSKAIATWYKLNGVKA